MIFDSIKKYYREIILLFTIFLDLIGFFGVIPPELEIVDKIIAWIVFAYFFYELSISRIFFGEKYPFIDIAVLFAYFNLITKNFLVFFSDILPNLSSESVIGIVSWFVRNSVSIEIYTFYTGAVLLIILSYYTAKSVRYKEGSLFSRLIGDRSSLDKGYIGAKEKAPSVLIKSIISFLVFNTFFVVVFNFLVEWLGFIEDDMITVISIELY